MCLTISQDNDYGIEPLETHIAWKVFSRLDGEWKTPIRGYVVDIKSSRLKPEKIYSACNSTSRILKVREVNGGAIHCFREEFMAKRACGTLDIVLKVKGYNHVAHNDIEVAYEEIQWEQRNWWWLRVKMCWNRGWTHGLWTFS